ncbi:hypothetical protein AU476_10280 [Cupriavidus sp. UYMSc13B]|nr:hypothetical protein AU476_10280 [Cupriavidus sp. UYMSc13B]
MRTVLADPDTKAKLEQQGAEPAWQSPEPFAATITAEQKRWGQAVKASGAVSTEPGWHPRAPRLSCAPDISGWRSGR